MATKAPVEVAEIRRRVLDFESLMRRAVEESEMVTSLVPEHREGFIRTWPSIQFSPLRLMEAFVAGNRYQIDRLPKFVAGLFDVVLELHYLTVLPGIQNQLVYLRGFDPKSPLANPRLLLVKHAMDQAEIGAIRILWERIMGPIYWLEVGQELANSNKKSKKGRFRETVASMSQWQALLPALDTLADHDDKFRTPEFHSSSVLRTEFLGQRVIDPNEIGAALAPVMNGLLELIESALLGTTLDIRLGGRVANADA